MIERGRKQLLWCPNDSLIIQGQGSLRVPLLTSNLYIPIVYQGQPGHPLNLQRDQFGMSVEVYILI